MPGRVACCGVAALAALGVLAGSAASSDQPTRLAWRLLDEQAPHFVLRGHSFTATLRIRNEGTETWRPELLDNVAYHWRSLSGEMLEREGRRTRLPRTVGPGEELSVTVSVDVRREAGLLILEWDMVRENVAWFGPPIGGGARHLIASFWQVSVLMVAVLLGTVGAVTAMRRFKRPGNVAWFATAATFPVVWVFAMTVVVTWAFAELADRSLWDESYTLHLSGAALIALPVALVPARGRAWVAAVFGATLVLVGTADIIYMRWFGSLVPLAAISAGHQLTRVGESIRALMPPGTAWMLLGLLPAGLLAVLWPRCRSKEAPGLGWRLGIATVVAVVVALAGRPAVTAIRWALSDRATSRVMFSQEQRVRQWGMVNLHVFDVVRAARNVVHPNALTETERARALELFSRRAAEAPSGGSYLGMAAGANLLLIQVESLQEWVVGARVADQAVTPTLDGLLRSGQALLFDRVFDQAAQGRSSDGEFAVLNSLLPLREGAVVFLCSDNRFNALPQILRRHGYATLSAHPFERGFWNRAVLHPRYGFERSLFQRELGPGERIGWGLADGVFFQRALPAITALHQPFYAHLITLGLHHPFDLFPERHKLLDVGELADTPLGNYLHAMHYFDASLARLLDRLREEGLLANTIVALYGDHTSGLEVDDAVLALAGEPRWEPSVLLRLNRVPVVVLLPGAAVSGEVGVIGGHVDIAPTLLYLLGVDRPGSFYGSALLPGRGGVTVLPNGSAVTDGTMYVTRGPNIPDEGACFSFPEGQPLPRSACDRIAALAAADLDATQLVLEHDLIPALSGETGR